MQPWPRHVPVEAGTPPNFQRTGPQNASLDGSIPNMNHQDIELIVRRALREDLPDITSEAIFDPGEMGQARFLVKAPGVLAGLPFASRTFHEVDPSSMFTLKRTD